MRTSNYEIRQAAKRAKVPFWMLAEHIGTSESGMSRKLRHELPDGEKQKLLAAIADISARCVNER